MNELLENKLDLLISELNLIKTMRAVNGQERETRMSRLEDAEYTLRQVRKILENREEKGIYELA